MRNFQGILYRLGLCAVLLVAAGCASNRQVSPQASRGTDHVPPPPMTQRPPADITETVEEVDSEPLEDPVDLLIAEARDLLDSGRQLFSAGNLEDARVAFRESLSILQDSPFDFQTHPRVENAYYTILREIQEVELQAWMDSEAAQMPVPEQTPLEEMADLDLFTIEVDPRLEEVVSRDLLEARFDIPVVLNEYVLQILNFYQSRRGRKIMEEGLRRSGKYLPLMREIFREEGVPADLVYMAHVESLFKPYAYSRARARGLWQFIVSTGRRYGLREDYWIDERSDVLKSTRAAARYLKDLYERFQDWHLALAAYNVGERRIERNMKRYRVGDYWTMVKRRLLPRETRQFVPSILAAAIIFRHPELYGFHVTPDPELRFNAVPLQDQVDLSVLAELIDVPLSDLQELNPELRRGITPFEYPGYRIKVPPDKAELVREKLASLPPEEKVRFRHHRIRQGQTLSTVASLYGTSVRAIAQMNGIRNIHRIREGQDLVIPLSSGVGFRCPSGSSVPDGHIVRKGDSLYRIARMYGVSVDDLLRWNGLQKKQTIYPGQRIRIGEQVQGAGGGQ